MREVTIAEVASNDASRDALIKYLDRWFDSFVVGEGYLFPRLCGEWHRCEVLSISPDLVRFAGPWGPAAMSRKLFKQIFLLSSSDWSENIDDTLAHLFSD